MPQPAPITDLIEVEKYGFWFGFNSLPYVDIGVISRSEFDEERSADLVAMRRDAKIQSEAIDLITHSIPHRLVYQTSWMGEPVLQLPQDLFAIQDILIRTRPKYVIEVGVAWAGSLLFYASLLPYFGGQGVIGIDTYVPDDLRERLRTKGEISRHVTLIEGSSLDPDVLSQVADLTKATGELFIHLDSDHTASHVRQELNVYGRLLQPGYYMLCGDTHVEVIPPDTYRGKPYGRGNNPMIALRQFLDSSDGRGFEIDEDASSRYLLSLNPSGFLVRSSDD